MLSTSFLTLGVMGLWLQSLWELGRHGRWVALAVWSALAAVACTADAYFAVLVFWAFFAKVPKLPVAVAVRQRLLPLPFRPILAAYWLLHFLAGAFMGVGMEWLLLERSHTFRDRPEMIFTMVMGYGFVYAANAYLLAAVAALTRRPRVLVIVWRLRLVIDLAISVGVPVMVRG